MRKIAVIMGTRPEAIKLAPVVRALQASQQLTTLVINTGQHRELIDQVIELFELPVDVDLAVMQPNHSLASLTARLLTKLDAVLDGSIDGHRPDMVLVQGDTTSVLAGALASFYRGIPVGHVEAGLRTGNMAAPFPEEANRRLTTPLVALHFAPTTTARDNLLAEGVEPSSIHVTGNTVVDALKIEIAAQQAMPLRATLDARVGEVLAGDNRPMVLITGHRRENFGGGFESICTAIATLAKRFSDHQFVYPVHLNPNVRDIVRQRLGELSNIRLLAPLGYRDFVSLMSRCRLVLTDSGGVQEEAPSLGKPVLVMRDTTERPEGVAAGTVRLVGSHAESIIAAVSELLTDEARYSQMAQATNPYGDGHAAPRIVDAINLYLDRP